MLNINDKIYKTERKKCLQYLFDLYTSKKSVCMQYRVYTVHVYNIQYTYYYNMEIEDKCHHSNGLRGFMKKCGTKTSQIYILYAL